MGLRVVDGLRTIDPANQGVDLTPVDRSAATVNATSVDMSNHAELLAIMSAGVIDAATNVAITIQESNEAAANFTNIASAIATLETGDDDQSVMVAVDWRHPDRLKYARLVGIVTGSGSALYGASSMRVSPLRDPTVGADVTVINA